MGRTPDRVNLFVELTFDERERLGRICQDCDLSLRDFVVLAINEYRPRTIDQRVTALEQRVEALERGDLIRKPG